ncbi:MAG: glycosyltransferase [Nitrospiraceae bacterium]|nr:glycosyltransferase [Nitrospiraceae bacterium]
MNPILSVAIPAHNEELHIARCVESIVMSARQVSQPVEVVVALNRCTDRTRDIAESLGARCVVEDTRCISAVRNAAVRATTAPAVVTLDADSWMSQNTISEILARVYEGRYVGGGCMVSLERYSVGIICSILAIAPYLVRQRVSIGMFWFLRESFDAIGGFDETLVSVEDLDFAVRLKSYGQSRGQRYGTIWRNGITTSCRKCDQFGDWYIFRNPRLVKALFSGRNRRAADHFWYDARR